MYSNFANALTSTLMVMDGRPISVRDAATVLKVRPVDLRRELDAQVPDPRGIVIAAGGRLRAKRHGKRWIVVDLDTSGLMFNFDLGTYGIAAKTPR